jgi:hypothetical protein
LTHAAFRRAAPANQRSPAPIYSARSENVSLSNEHKPIEEPLDKSANHWTLDS